MITAVLIFAALIALSLLVSGVAAHGFERREAQARQRLERLR